jgi:hypothetical protein
MGSRRLPTCRGQWLHRRSRARKSKAADGHNSKGTLESHNCIANLLDASGSGVGTKVKGRELAECGAAAVSPKTAAFMDN